MADDLLAFVVILTIGFIWVLVVFALFRALDFYHDLIAMLADDDEDDDADSGR